MTQRLYYDDPYTTEFTARVVETLSVAGQPAVILDRTYFYPTGGGQPADRGSIDGVDVLDVAPREEDAAVLHVLAAPPDSVEVQCRIDWPRRFDHMQHHTGQHILTQAFVQVAEAHTVSFHLSEDSVTIDLDKPPMPPEVVAKVEDLANRVICEDRPVTQRLVDPSDTEGVRMRRMPGHLLTDGLRVIEVEGFDQTACGGTHVARTGEIGLIKIVRLDRHADGTRVEFRCGGRALHDYREKNDILLGLAAQLTCGYWEIGGAIDRLRADLKETQRMLRANTARLIEAEAAHLLASAEVRDGVRVISAAFEDRDVADVRALASRLVETPGTLVLFGLAGEKSQLILARSADLPHNMNQPLQAALPHLGDARGGGRPDFTQGGGVPAGLDAVRAALDAAAKALAGE